MSRGFYSATAAMMSDMDRFEVVANNLANINTNGYKRNQTLHHDFQEGFLNRVQNARMQLSVNAQGEAVNERVPARPLDIGELGTGTFITNNWTSYANGSLQESQGPFDMALKGDGFFTLQGPEGQVRYTRNGHFMLNRDNELVTSDGWKLQGQNGSIELDTNAKITIDGQGQIYSNGQAVDQLKLVGFDQPQLLWNEGDNRYSALPGMAESESTATVAQGFLEQSNVDAATEMVQMISALRSYQISQKALQSEDEMSGRLINDVGRS